MNRETSTREAWQPQTPQEREAILRELHEVIASPYFCNSKRYPALLQYIVENTLAGKSDRLKERTLGIEVFDRPSTYDTNAEAVVRFTAGEVRKRLLLYYTERGRTSGIRISLPVGSYIPEFLHEPNESDESKESAGFPTGQLRANVSADIAVQEREPRPLSLMPLERRPSQSALQKEAGLILPPTRTRAYASLLWFGLAATLAIGFLAGLGWKSRSAYIPTAVDDFWRPLLHEAHGGDLRPRSLLSRNFFS